MSRLLPCALVLCGCLSLAACSSVEQAARDYWLNDEAEPATAADADTPRVPEGSGLAYRPDSRDRKHARHARQTHAQRDPLHQGFSPSVTHKRLNDYAEQLAMGLMDNAQGLTREDLIGVASFVRFNRSLQDTTVVGNQLAEYLMGELQSYGVSVVDFKLANNIAVTPHGDLALSRDGKALASSLAMDHIVTGTMIEDPRGVRVNARIVSVENQQLMASASLYIPGFMVQSVIPATTTGR
ncbi:FlgO family outer membrane protein [Alteromonas halophila]|uniref:FlgO domain-containing protein n=1 Tax=Alteromonas halophila TaxID=516698 RepID=A0A918JQ74_9ALTE|nr:FlgO family outer membrane protein [Alteromonas halophila]GGW95095.1 hypothetical protein GCM10007391_31670 [Alteromonas halophila]